MSSTLYNKVQLQLTRPACGIMPAQVSLCRLGGHVKLLYFALLVAVCLAPTQEKSVAENSVEASIRHVTVINAGNGSELKDQTVTVRGNRIASIAPTRDSDSSLSNSTDARGAFLIPGLWDLRVHVQPRRIFPRPPLPSLPTHTAASIWPSARRSSRNSVATTLGKFQRSRF